MSLAEFLTTYLAIGAPFGVYYFLKRSGKSIDIALYTKSIGVTLFWFLFAARLLKRRHISLKNTLLRSTLDFSLENKIDRTSQSILNIFAALPSDSKTPSYFEFRETLERYIGLTITAQNSSANSPAVKHELEIFRIAGHQRRALKLAEKIIHRKNYLRLQSHQSFARQDFLQVCQGLKEKFWAESNGKLEIWQQYQTEVMRLSNLLNDGDATQSLLKLRETPYIEPQLVETRNKQERDLWITVQQSP